MTRINKRLIKYIKTDNSDISKIRTWRRLSEIEIVINVEKGLYLKDTIMDKTHSYNSSNSNSSIY